MSYYDTTTGKKLYEHNHTFRGDVADLSVEMPRICGTPTLMIRKEIFETIGGTYNDNIGGSDWEMVARICQITKVDYIPKSLVRVYTNHSCPRLSVDAYNDRIRENITFHNHFLTYFKSNFERCPQYAKYHYYQLAKNHFELGNKKKAWQYILKFYSKPIFYIPRISQKDIFYTIWKLIKI